MTSIPTTEKIDHDNIGSKATVYLDFDKYLDQLAAEERGRLSDLAVLFCFPVLDRNESDLPEHPISQRILVSVARQAGCHVESQLAFVDSDQVKFSPNLKKVPSHIVIHPTIGSLEGLVSVVKQYRKAYPRVEIILHNSDQHQHEKMIGGPGGEKIAGHLLDTIDGIDSIILGFAEHSLLSLLLGKPTAAVVRRAGRGIVPARFFNFASLPSPELPAESQAARSRTIRVQRSRGCLSPCTYCIEGQANRWSEKEKPWDGGSIKDFVDELENLQEKGFFFINVIDSSFEDPGRRGISDLLNICRGIVERKLTLSFKIHLRAETVLKFSRSDFDLMKAAGIDVLVIGIESGSQLELDFYKKIATKDVSRKAFKTLEAMQGRFCVILGYIMFSPISTSEILREKTEFLRDIERGWDFLNLTNRLRVYWGTRIHHQLVKEGLSDDTKPTPDYVPFRFREDAVATLDEKFSRLKSERPGFSRLNRLIYDALNLEARMLNPANAAYLDLAGQSFTEFQQKLKERKRYLSDLYADAFLSVIDQPNSEFLPRFDPDEYADALEGDVKNCLSFVDQLEPSPTTLQLQTWLSVFDRFGPSA